MNQTDKQVKYILLEDEHITVLGLKRTVSRLRPAWSLIAESDSSADIPRLIKLTPDLIISDIYLADGTSTDMFELHCCPIPVILLTGYPVATEHCHKVPNLVTYIEKPVAHTDLEQAFRIWESIIIK